MKTYWIVKAIDVLRDASGCLFVSFVDAVLDFFSLVTLEKRFHWRVVVAVAAAAHALGQFILAQPLAESVAGILGSSVAVNDQARRWVT